jgi:hypothetical protein
MLVEEETDAQSSWNWGKFNRTLIFEQHCRTKMEGLFPDRDIFCLANGYLLMSFVVICISTAMHARRQNTTSHHSASLYYSSIYNCERALIFTPQHPSPPTPRHHYSQHPSPFSSPSSILFSAPSIGASPPSSTFSSPTWSSGTQIPVPQAHFRGGRQSS